MQCRKCSASIHDDAKFCPACGVTNIIQEKCYKCSSLLTPTDCFCSECGARVGTGVAISQVWDVVFRIFPNLLIEEKVNRSNFWQLNIFAIVLSLPIAIIVLVVSEFIFKTLWFSQLLANATVFYIYIRVCGHIVNGRLIDTGLITMSNIKKYGSYVAIFFIFSPIILGKFGQILQMLLTIALWIICLFYPTKSIPIDNQN